MFTSRISPAWSVWRATWAEAAASASTSQWRSRSHMWDFWSVPLTASCFCHVSTERHHSSSDLKLQHSVFGGFCVPVSAPHNDLLAQLFSGWVGLIHLTANSAERVWHSDAKVSGHRRCKSLHTVWFLNVWSCVNHFAIIVINIEPNLIWIKVFLWFEGKLWNISCVNSLIWFSQTAELLWFLSWSKAAVLLPDVKSVVKKPKLNNRRFCVSCSQCDDTKGKSSCHH